MKKLLNKKSLTFTLILFISVGFAILSSNLNILGRFQFLESSFEVYFDNIRVISNSIEAANPVIDNNKTTITFGGTFYEPGDVYEYSVDVVNNGTMGAMLDEIIKTGITSENEDFINYTVNYFDGTSLNRYDLLKAGAKTRIIVKVEYKYDIEELPNISNNMGFSLSLKYVKSNNKAINVDTNFYNSEKNNNFTLSNTKANSLMDLKINGNTEQTTYTGQQLIKKDGFSTPLSDTEFWVDVGTGVTPLQNGWVRVEYDNSSGSDDKYQNLYLSQSAVDIEPNKEYTIVLEYRNFTEEFGSIHVSQTFQELDPFKYVAGKTLYSNYLYGDEVQNSPNYGIKTFYVVTKDSIENTFGLRAFVGIFPGKSCSIEVRVSIIEGTDVTADNFVYEPYVGGIASPNPEYPQEVTSITGNTELKITGKNLFNIGDNTTTYHGIEAKREGSLITLNGTTLIGGNLLNSSDNTSGIPSIGIFKAGTYTFSIDTNSNYNDHRGELVGRSASAFYLRKSDNYALVSKELNSQASTTYQTSFTLTEDTELFFQLFSNSQGIEFDNYNLNIQIEAGSTKTNWEQAKVKDYTISLGNNVLNKLGNYRDYIFNINNKWYIHKEIEKYTITGNEQLSINTDSDDTTLLVYNNVLGNNAKDYNSSISNRLQYNKMLNSDEEGFYFDDNSKKLTLRINKSTIGTTGSDVSTYFQNNQTYFYYVLANPVEVEITDSTLVGQLNAIYNNGNNNLYDGINNITYTSNIDTDIEFNYKAN